MSATLVSPMLAPPIRAAGHGLVLEIDVEEDASVLVRVLTILRRRGCVIRSVDYDAGDWHRPGHLSVAVVAPPSHAHCVGAWLENAVHVREVRVRQT
jgi:acetolactate synthase regulatory subunit